MRVRVCAFFPALLLLPSTISSQQATTTSTQPSAILAQSLAAMGGSVSVSDITLTGTVERVVGSDDETGSASYKAIASANRMDLSLSSGTRSEIRAIGSNGRGGNWVGPDGVVHEISFHNLLTEVGWFPVFTLSNLASASNGVLTYVGPDTKNGISVIHIQFSQQQPNITGSAATIRQHLTQMDIYVDASTFLPVALDFNTHPDDNALIDIPVEFQFSDYGTVGSLHIPFHVQQSLNGSLFLDVQFQQASINTGLSSTSSIFTIH
jgi:hypothetical protein